MAVTVPTQVKTFIGLDDQDSVHSTELSTGRMDPRVGSGHDFDGNRRVGSALWIFKFFTVCKNLQLQRYLQLKFVLCMIKYKIKHKILWIVKKLLCDVTWSSPPPSVTNCHTFLRPPSWERDFMDGPLIISWTLGFFMNRYTMNLSNTNIRIEYFSYDI